MHLRKRARHRWGAGRRKSYTVRMCDESDLAVVKVDYAVAGTESERAVISPDAELAPVGLPSESAAVIVDLATVD